MSAAARAKLSARMRGRHLSAATRAKIAAADRARARSRPRRPAKPRPTVRPATARRPTGGKRVSAQELNRTPGLHPVRQHRAANTAPGAHGYRQHRRPKIGRTAGRRLISAHRRRSLKGLVHIHRRRHRSRIVIRRHVRAHHVWRRKRR
jgi:hypothetical protein